jgi:DNA polymerase I
MAKISWESGLDLERDCAILLKEQEENGVYFDLEKALFLIEDLDRLKAEQEESVRPYFKFNVIPLEQKIQGEYKYISKIYLKNGDYTKSILSHYPENPFIVEGSFSRIEIEEPSISKRKIIIEQLLRLGWKPTTFTEKGFPKLTDKGEPVDTLLEVGDFGKALSMWYVYSHRQSQIKGFLPHVRLDGRIPSCLNSCATNTFRASHKIVANIPRPTSVYGKEMRSLFCVKPGRRFVGADLSGIEARLLAHHMNSPEYIDVILRGDVHLYHLSKTQNYILKKGNVDLSNLKDEKKRLAVEREIIKAWFYAFIYGSGDSKSGKIIGGSAKDGKLLKDTFFKELPALSNLLNKVRNFAEKYGYLPSIDMRKIYLRSYEGRLLTHTALNCLLQANGSIVAKRAMLIANDEIKKRGLDAFQIIFYHDEFAYDSDNSCAEEVGNILVDSMRLAGEYYNLNIPISGEYGIGDNWGIH